METSVYRFFHDQLPDDSQRAFYNAAEKGIRARLSVIICPCVANYTDKDYKRILEHVYDDHPELFYFYPLLCEITIDGFMAKVKPYYRYTVARQLKYEKELERTIEIILKQCFPNGYECEPELKREKIIFDWLTKNVTYDYQSLDTMKHNYARHIRSVAWNAYGALVCRKAVCEGVACAFKLLCDRVSLPCIVVLGQGAKERHAWNIVRINKKFYHVDCTWDLRSSIAIEIPYAKYRYFNLPDRIIGTNHTPESCFLPRCGSLQYNPFKIKKLCAFTPEETMQIARRMIDEGQKRFAVMTIGFEIANHCDAICQDLARYSGSEVKWYLDNSGYFIGFVID